MLVLFAATRQPKTGGHQLEVNPGACLAQLLLLRAGDIHVGANIKFLPSRFLATGNRGLNRLYRLGNIKAAGGGVENRLTLIGSPLFAPEQIDSPLRRLATDNLRGL